MYIAVKNNTQTAKFIGALKEYDVEMNVNERAVITFISANLDSSKLSAILQVWDNKLAVFETESGKNIATLNITHIHCVYSL